MAEDKELNELDKFFSSILVGEDSKLTITMEELNKYIDKKMEEKYQEKIDEQKQINSDLSKRIELLEEKNTKLELSINEMNNHNYTCTELASTTSITRDNVVTLKENLSNFKYIWIVYKSKNNENIHGSGIIPVNVFKTIGSYLGANNGNAAGGAEVLVMAKYKNENEVYLYKSADYGNAVLYGIK